MHVFASHYYAHAFLDGMSQFIYVLPMMRVNIHCKMKFHTPTLIQCHLQSLCHRTYTIVDGVKYQSGLSIYVG